ncbi:hypothetical protein HMPREF1057_00033 [Bacteroides finegoldii CL09T03C10]|uniref:Uncharacterized protein n=1 Tax=Bacteroides finegoldii CL09T03C10 TaxID=997888 RepID=K5CTJ7_9BACE|nr:hypothetical protein HMPREF1057_00033 [Bacteroides finegoldii CL09T03C10]
MEKPDSSPLSRQALHADKKQWNQFLSIFLLAVGVGFTVWQASSSFLPITGMNYLNLQN